MLTQEFLSLAEASDFVKSKGLNLEEWDLIFLASKGEFRAFNNIYSIPRFNDSNPLYKINGLKGVFESIIETQLLDVTERITKALTDSNIEVLQSSNGYKDILLLKDKQTKIEVEVSYNPYGEFHFSELRYPYASVYFPVFDGLGKQFDIINGMVESRMLEDISSKNFLNSKLFYKMLQKSLNNYYVVNSPLDHFYFKLKEIIFYPIGLQPYYISSDELSNNNDLKEIYDEEDFSNIFYFQKEELEAYINKSLQIETQLEQTDMPLIFEGNIPSKTDQDKLAHFIKLIIQKSEFRKDGRMPTYSELHTMLSHKYPNEAIPSKNTLKKYLEP
ncbi:hypothetical protein [Mannheimia granulomatis]|uniref:hypothetical protein n=1 Tax=Mannheimia granulomatis TaxID=85402 RepID=UPI00047EC83A|nr:hypothetical protein [Mannheimia granulomatis]QLB19567.1 hypothetical protein A6B41_08995 [Mannheimia granulomatis]